MKYIKYFTLIIICLMPINVLAYGVQFICPKEIKPNETFSCTIYSPSFCSEISMELILPDGFTLKDETAGKNFKSASEGNKLSYIATGDIDRVLSTLQITAPTVTNSNKLSITLKNVKYKYQEKDNEYSVTTDLIEDINFTGKISDEEENFVLTLKSNDEKDDQTLSCTPANGSCDILLTNTNIPTKAGYSFNGWGQEEGCTKGETEKYTLKSNTTLYACFTTSTVGHLKKLVIEGYPIEFNTNVFNYTIDVDNNISNLKIDAESFNKDAKIDIDNPILSNEVNIVTITVTEEGTVLTYIINANKNGLVRPLISSLLIRDQQINFDSNTFNYDLTISKKTKVLDIAATPDMDDAKVEIIGNNNLTEGSIITIIVLADSGASNTYTINIHNIDIWNTYKYYFISAIVVVFMFTVYFIVRHIKIKNGEYKTNNSSVKVETNKDKILKESKPKKVKVKKEKKVKKKKGKNQDDNIETLDL